MSVARIPRPHRPPCLLIALLLAACGGSTEEAVAPEAPEPSAPVEPAPVEDTDPDGTVARLEAEFDTAARNSTTTAEAQTFIREHEARLTRLYVDDHGELSPKTRVQLINLLVSFQTEGTAPAHAAAISRYARGEASVDEAIWACQAAKRIKSPEIAAALMQAFDAIDMGDADGQRFGRHLADAMEFNAVASWRPTLEKRRDATVEPLDSFENPDEVRKYRNQKYWQETAVRLLARLDAGSE